MADEVTAIDQACCADHPPLPPGRRRWGRIVFDHDERRRGRQCRSHDRRRVAVHRLTGDPKRVGCYVGATASPFFGVFGDLSAVLRPDVVQIIKFPVRRNAIAELRAEVEEMKKLLVRA